MNFIPALKSGGTTTGREALSVKANLNTCNVITPLNATPLTITSGTVTGKLFSNTGSSCATLLLGAAGNLGYSGTLTIKWKVAPGTPKLLNKVTKVGVNSLALGIDLSGASAITIPGLTPGTVTGAFSALSANSVSYNVGTQTLAQSTASCLTKAGLHSIRAASGMVTFGAPPSALIMFPVLPDQGGIIDPNNTNPEIYDPQHPQAFEAVGLYQVAPSQYGYVNLSHLASWASSDEGVATIGTPVFGWIGVNNVASGTTTISATFAGMSAHTGIGIDYGWDYTVP